MKHLQIRHLWLQEGFRRADFSLATVKSGDNIADVLTNNFAGSRHCLLRQMLGLRAPPAGEAVDCCWRRCSSRAA
eukprot:14373177-Heterocapsa_arctica.AAC.1